MVGYQSTRNRRALYPAEVPVVINRLVWTFLYDIGPAGSEAEW